MLRQSQSDSDVADAAAQDGGGGKRRQRARLACVRCHKLKVKCDRLLPCNRCRTSGWAGQCNYTHVTDAPAAAASSSSVPEEPTSKTSEPIGTWYNQARPGHWKELLPKLGSLAGMESPIFRAAVEDMKQHGDCSTEFALPVNFPFNNTESRKYSSNRDVYNLIAQHRQNLQTYVLNYMALYQPLYPIIDVAEFYREVTAFHDNYSGDGEWLAEYLLVLGLGSYSLSTDPTTAEEFFMAAAACLSRTPVMYRPTLAALRAMCLLIVAKQIANATCWTFESCWMLLGTVSRLALSLGLHRCRHGQRSERSESIESLWTVVQHFEIQLSFITGLPPAISVDGMTEPSAELMRQLDGYSAESIPWLTAISESYPTILEILRRVHSDTEKPSFAEVSVYNAKIRYFMRRWINPQQQPTAVAVALDIFFRQVLLIVHRDYALDPNGPAIYPESYWASLECSLAMLGHHRDLLSRDQQPVEYVLLVRFFAQDFFSAAITVCAHLLLRDAPLASGFAIPPRQTIIMTLSECVEFWAAQSHKSVCLRTAHRLLDALLVSIRMGG